MVRSPGVVAYGGAGVTAGFGGALGGALIQPISKIAERPLGLGETGAYLRFMPFRTQASEVKIGTIIAWTPALLYLN